MKTLTRAVNLSLGALALGLCVTARAASPTIMITMQPQNQIAFLGSNVTFSVTATDTALLRFQWRKDGANLTDGGGIVGARTNALSLSNLQASDAGSYDVLVTNSDGSVASQTAVLIVVGRALEVGNTNDSGPGSLRQALADGAPGDLIRVTVIGVISGGLIINKSLTLTGPGATNLMISGGGPVFRVETNVTFNLLGLSVACGSASQGAGLYNNGGRLWISDCVFATNRACGSNGSPGASDVWWGGPGTDGQPGKGGAILNLGTLTLTHCGFYDNLASGGNGGSGGDASGWAGAVGGSAGRGAAGEGGAIYNAGELAFHDCQFVRNQAVGGSGGDGGYGGELNGFGGAGAEARGGAILDLSRCAGSDSGFMDNTAHGGKGGNPGGSIYFTGSDDGGQPGGNAEGGAICDSGRVALSGCSLAGNRVSGGPGGSGGATPWSGGRGGWGKGGAVCASVALSMVNSTVAYNLAAGGLGGAGGTLNWRGGTNGTDSWVSGADLTGGYISLTNCTICSTGEVASVDVTAGGATLVNSILVNSGAGAPYVGLVSLSVANFLQGEPRLYPLGYYGGPTQTMPPNCDSPVIDAGDDSLCPPTDQRGVRRPLEAGSDIGACEGCPSSAPEGPRMLPGSLVCSNDQFSFKLQSQPGLSFEVQASTNLVNWATVATLTNNNGIIPFTTPTAGFTRRFYRARQLP